MRDATRSGRAIAREGPAAARARAARAVASDAGPRSASGSASRSSGSSSLCAVLRAADRARAARTSRTSSSTLQPPSLAAPVRHRQPRPRHLLARRLRRADRPAWSASITTYVPLVLGVLARARRRLLRRLARDASSCAPSTSWSRFPFIVLVIAVDRDRRPGPARRLHRRSRSSAGRSTRGSTRAEMLVLREQQFMLAATSLGYSHARIMLAPLAPEPDPAEPRLLDASTSCSTSWCWRRSRSSASACSHRPPSGADGRRGPDLPAHRLVDLDAARARDRARRRRLQPDRRRPRRRLGAAASGASERGR